MTEPTVRTILLCQALRGLGYGFVAVQLGAVLRDRGFSSTEVGLVLAAIVAGSVTATLLLARWGDRVGHALVLSRSCCGLHGGRDRRVLARCRVSQMGVVRFGYSSSAAAPRRRAKPTAAAASA